MFLLWLPLHKSCIFAAKIEGVELEVNRTAGVHAFFIILFSEIAMN